MSLEEPYGPLTTSTLELLTWNVWGRFGPWEQRQNSLIKTIRAASPDVVALQESWATDVGLTQAERLASTLGYDHWFSGSPSLMFDGWGPVSSVLSRWPILEAQDRELPAAEGERGWPGSALSCVIDGERCRVPLVNVALDWPPQSSSLRQASVAQIARIAKDTGRDEDFPVVVCGDFNADPQSTEMRGLMGLHDTPIPGFVLFDAWDKAGEGDGVTWDRNNQWASPTLLPSRRIDYILTGWPNPDGGAGDVLSARLVGADEETPASDHYGVAATLRC